MILSSRPERTKILLHIFHLKKTKEKERDQVELHLDKKDRWIDPARSLFQPRTLLLAFRKSDIKFCNPLAWDDILYSYRNILISPFTTTRSTELSLMNTTTFRHVLQEQERRAVLIKNISYDCSLNTQRMVYYYSY